MAKAKKVAVVSVGGNMSLLSALAVATASGGVMYTSDADRADVNPLHIEINPNMKNDLGNVATRISAAGQAFLSANSTQSGTTGGETPTASKFKLFDNVVLPVSKRGGRKSSEYPFADMALNQGFFVVASADMEDPHKSLASTVSSASARYATDHPTETVTRNITVELTNPDGSAIFEADGKTPKTEKRTKTEPKKVYGRKFKIVGVDDGTPYGYPAVNGVPQKGALISRII